MVFLLLYRVFQIFVCFMTTFVAFRLGSFMVIAWVGFAVSAIFYARYMKVVWTNKTISGENIWFQVGLFNSCHAFFQT